MDSKIAYYQHVRGREGPIVLLWAVVLRMVVAVVLRWLCHGIL